MNNGPEHTHLEERNGEEALDPAFEAQLHHALRHTDPPAGFADRLMARAIAGDRPAPVAVPLAAAHAASPAKILRWPVRSIWGRGAIAAALLLGLLEGGISLKHVREQQRRIAQATEQFQTSERVTVRALAQAREQLQRAGVPLTLD